MIRNLRARQSKKRERRDLMRLAKTGLLTPPSREALAADFKPLKLAGRPLSQQIIEDREDRV